MQSRIILTIEMCTPAWKIDDNDNMIVHEPCRSESCEQLDTCTKVGGRCMRKCEYTTVCPVQNDLSPESQDCNCKILECNFETRECYANGYNYIPKINYLVSSSYDCKP